MYTKALIRSKLALATMGQARRLIQDQSGAYLIMTSLALPVIIGSFGFMSEVMTWYSARQLQQNAADAAVLSAASAKASGDNNVLFQVRGIAGSYGYIHNDTNVKVEFNSPPTTGPNTANSSAIEVIITTTQPASFSKVFGRGDTTVIARSVAMNSGTKACLMELNKTAKNAISFQGSTTVNLAGCTVVGNSTDAQAMVVSGSASLTTKGVVMSGGVSATAGLTSTDGIKQYQPATVDPYASLTVAKPTTCNYNGYETTDGAVLNPGVYCWGINFKTGTSVTLKPGVYYIAGGWLNMTASTAKAVGTGVTFVMTAAPGTSSYGLLWLTGGTFNITAPTSGTFAGIVFYGDRNAPLADQKITGGSNYSFGGAMYLPRATLSFNGGAANTTTTCTQIIADTVQFTGNTNLALNCGAYNSSFLSGKLALSE